MNNFNCDDVLSTRTSAVELASIIKMSQKARRLAARGHDVVLLTLGEPDFDTPGHIKDAAVQAMAEGFTHYSPVAGLPETRAAVAAKLTRENGLDCAPEHICMTNGAKQAITNAVFALADPGDEVILLTPYWVSYEGIIRMAGAVPVIVSASLEDGFKVPAERLERAITARTKLVILNTPCNPTGAMYTRAELEAIADVIKAHPRAMVLADEIYEHIVFEGEHVSIGALAGMSERTITVNGFSKAFAMTGWRLGYSAASEPVTRAMAKVQSTFTAGANSFVQRAGIRALEGERQSVEEMREIYRRRRDAIIAGLKIIPGVKAVAPAGTFYVFPDVGAHIGEAGGGRFANVDDLANRLLEDHHVATVPGSAFGDDRSIRLSFAASDQAIASGLERLAAGLS